MTIVIVFSSAHCYCSSGFSVGLQDVTQMNSITGALVTASTYHLVTHNAVSTLYNSSHPYSVEGEMSYCECFSLQKKYYFPLFLLYYSCMTCTNIVILCWKWTTCKWSLTVYTKNKIWFVTAADTKLIQNSILVFLFSECFSL